MAKKSAVKITVLKKISMSEVHGDDSIAPGLADVCEVLEEGEEFFVPAEGGKPEGFCAWAWADMDKVYTVLRFGGNLPWMKEPGVGVVACTDGLRPVVFKLERVE
jgi:uncharacterized repeat protein (TIGR04076 family)